MPADVANNLDGKDVFIHISTNLVTPAWSLLVCQINGGLNGSRDVQTQQTKCGTAKSAGSPNYQLTGSLAANSTPDTGEISADDLIALFESGDSFLWKLAHTTPANYYRSGTGFFSSYNETANDGEMVQADFTIDVEGGVDITP